MTTVSQHLGGIHSGCALSGIGWLVLKVVNNYRHHTVNPDLILVVGTITNVTVVVGALSALPWIRNNHHKWVVYSGTTLPRLTYPQCFRASSSVLRMVRSRLHL